MKYNSKLEKVKQVLRELEEIIEGHFETDPDESVYTLIKMALQVHEDFVADDVVGASPVMATIPVPMPDEERKGQALIIDMIDKDRGGIQVRKDSQGAFDVWLEFEELGGRYWSLDQSFANLSLAMLHVSEILEHNANNDFYED